MIGKVIFANQLSQTSRMGERKALDFMNCLRENNESYSFSIPLLFNDFKHLGAFFRFDMDNIKP